MQSNNPVSLYCLTYGSLQESCKGFFTLTILDSLPDVPADFLTFAIGRLACSLNYKAIYLSMNHFIEKLSLAMIDGSYFKLLNQLEKIPLIILDDFGLAPMENNAKLTLLRLLQDRYGRRYTIIASQLPVNKWHQYLNEPTLADAIMD